MPAPVRARRKISRHCSGRHCAARADRPSRRRGHRTVGLQRPRRLPARPPADPRPRRCPVGPVLAPTRHHPPDRGSPHHLRPHQPPPPAHRAHRRHPRRTDPLIRPTTAHPFVAAIPDAQLTIFRAIVHQPPALTDQITTLIAATPSAPATGGQPPRHHEQSSRWHNKEKPAPDKGAAEPVDARLRVACRAAAPLRNHHSHTGLGSRSPGR